MEKSVKVSKECNRDDLKTYLEYLDKEMTIMGILSTFCILTMGFTAEKLFFVGKDSPYQFWKNVNILCTAGLASFLLAAFSFYRQRSLLAYYYGLISLHKARGEEDKLSEVLNDSVPTQNWMWYQIGFGWLAMAFLTLGAIGLSSIHPFFATNEIAIVIVIFCLCAIYTGFFVVAYIKYWDQDNPIDSLFRKIFHIAAGRKHK